MHNSWLAITAKSSTRTLKCKAMQMAFPSCHLKPKREQKKLWIQWMFSMWCSAVWAVTNHSWQRPKRNPQGPCLESSPWDGDKRMAKQPCSCTWSRLRSQGWVNSTLRLFDAGNQSHTAPKTSSTSAWRISSRTSWSGEDEGPSKKLHLVARNQQGNWGNREDLLGLPANAGWT